ncbi:endopeptidase La [Frankia sp. CNm7]|uniref:Lon protease n=1 Tax=Frankia nepalensis TaxID=1836974 RepID=A0A937RFQ2_9ACTN|nr:endopeptidase La [Frankia nepalensis]MBL7501909.1 endopeptidase La [Frankia nepalensis]MBL7513914.1 endopeptidase La [Frankia nepalensis]MBL7521349.1 endopeptidase La [Frankia nepalensis]MBL7629570.1 endopeptidase La [Frankia nepalensis]
MTQTRVLPVLPLDDAVVLPGMVVPLELSDVETRAAVDAARAAAQSRSPDGAGTARSADARLAQVLLTPRLDGRYAPVAALGVIEQIGRLPGGEPAVVVRAVARARIGTGSTGPGAALWVEATVLDSVVPASGKVADLAREYKALVTTLLQQRGAWQVVDSVTSIEDPSALADTAGYAPYLTAAQKLELLETADVADRLEKALGWVKEHLAELDVAETIRKDVQEGMDRQQREFLLRRQLEAVRKELRELDGRGDGDVEESDDYRARVEAADLPEKVRAAALKEVDKLERTSDASPEGGWIRTWLDTILDVPWNERTEDSYDIAGARAVLDADHAGLDDVKDRIIEYLAVRRRRADAGLGVVGGRRSGAVLALAGPPGVGKTSLGESVARAMGRRFVRVALGGVRDEAEIRGHRRTYVGALPGRIVRAVREAGTMNPVVLLDEVDKLGADYRGDPTAALLEVLDPAQNHTFRDHYLEVELDLSDVLFLATANVVEAIPAPLLDRMELVRLDGYTEDEKVVIARDHLLPRQRERAGFAQDDVTLDDEALRLLAGEYTREAGVRDLERSIARVLRKVAARVALDAPSSGEPADGASGSADPAETDLAGTDLAGTGPADDGAPATGGVPAREAVTMPARVGAGDLVRYLGRPRHTPELAERTALPGVATGLAVTGAGGDVLFIEASLADKETGATGLTLTGQLGDVMKESAQIALSYLRSRGAELELPVGDLAARGVHVHVPAGAVPKDGPSAGITMTTALASLLSGRPVRSDVAMTGEVSLTGRVLPIGGVKQKLLAAHRAGITTVLLPSRNGPDLDDVPAAVRGALTVHLVSDVREVLDLALEPAAFDPGRQPMVAA